MADLQRGKYFDEFEIGMSFTSPGRTISESDIVSFAGLSVTIHKFIPMQSLVNRQ